MKRLLIFILSIILNCIVLSQDTRLQISDDNNPVVGASYTKMDSTGKIWIAYICYDSLLHVGNYYNNLWTKTHNITLPEDIYALPLNPMTMDDSLYLWFAFLDTRRQNKVCIFKNDFWNYKNLDIPTRSNYILIPKSKEGIWYISSESYEIDIRCIDKFLNTDSNYYRFFVPIQNSYDIENLQIGGFSASNSMYLSGSCYSMSNLLGGESASLSFLFSFENKKIIVIKKINTTYFQETVRNLSFGNARKHNYIVTRELHRNFQSSLFSANHIVYQLDTAVRRFWTDIIPKMDSDYLLKVTSSRNANIFALAWIFNDNLFIKVLKDTIWYKTKVINEDEMVTSKDNLSIFVEKDSIVWISYTGIKNGNRHMFLQKVIQDWEIDERATGIKTKYPEKQNVKYELYQNYPNPFNPSTNIIYSVGASERSPLLAVQLKIYDVLGREVSVLVNEMKRPGKYEVEFDASAIPSGMYFYRLQVGDFLETKRMIVLK